MPCSMDFKRYLSKFKSTDLNQVISGKCGRISVYKAFNPWIEIRLYLESAGVSLSIKLSRCVNRNNNVDYNLYRLECYAMQYGFQEKLKQI